MSNGIVIYRGPSVLDGAPIVVIATGIAKSSNNEKTGGGLIQTWIIREDVSPTEAVNTGQDASICGSCRHRGEVIDGKNVGRSCYVTVFQAPLNVWKSYHRGIYPIASPEQLKGLFTGRMVRLGSYGDPAAVPFEVWQEVMEGVLAKTGYTHAWRDHPALKVFCMASCDTPEEREEASSQGWRTFRVRATGEASMPREVVCPASQEAGFKTTCDACKACGGLSAKAKADIVITVHGAASRVNAFQAAR